MKNPTFFHGVLTALTLAVAGAVVFAASSPMFGSVIALRAVITLLAGLYVLYVLRSSSERTGRVVTPAIWLTTAVIVWLFVPSLAAFAATHVLLIWLIRSLYHHVGVLTALADLALSAFALAAAIWAASSGSLFRSAGTMKMMSARTFRTSAAHVYTAIPE